MITLTLSLADSSLAHIQLASCNVAFFAFIMTGRHDDLSLPRSRILIVKQNGSQLEVFNPKPLPVGCLHRLSMFRPFRNL